MLFNSLDFAIFLPIVFVLYWVLNKNLMWQNLLVVVASYVFYGWWDWRFLGLIIFSTLINYSIGLAIHNSEQSHKRKRFLWVGVGINLLFLGYFKYFNFFLDNLADAFSFFGHDISTRSLDIVLPIGISFYTFQTLSYIIDIYRQRIEPTSNYVVFSGYVAFFPQLVAGPIERAKHLLPQFLNRRIFSALDVNDGLRQILWGVFKKMVIADNCAKYVDLTFSDPLSYAGSDLLFGAFLYSVQLYADFSGYCDIAIGSARLFGFRLSQNFAFPYFARDIAEFWRRWHICLSRWFKDYVYIPMGGSQVSKWKSVRNVFIIFLISGFWHGDNWTFIVWGGLNALFYMPLLLLDKNRDHVDIVAKGRWFPSVRDLINIFITFTFTVLVRIFFRANDIQQAWDYFRALFTKSLFTEPIFSINEGIVLAFFFLMLAIEWKGRQHLYGLEKLGFNWPRWMRWSMYSVFIFIVGIYFNSEESPFIYFQF